MKLLILVALCAITYRWVSVKSDILEKYLKLIRSISGSNNGFIYGLILFVGNYLIVSIATALLCALF